jgi:hypothetical protein
MFAGLVYAIGGFIEILIGLRFVFRLIGANPATPFVQWIYDWSRPFVAPFAGIFGQNTSTAAGPSDALNGMFDWTALISLIIIGLIVGILGSLLTRNRARY